MGTLPFEVDDDKRSENMTDTERRIRLFVEADLSAGSEIPLTSDQAHYLKNVMRADGGDRVRLFNGRDGEWRARLATLDKRRASAVAEARCRPQAEDADLWLLFAPIKRGPTDLIVEKATELGVSVLAPVLTQRTQVDRVNLRRLRTLAIEAAEQCGRLTVPDLRDPVPLKDALANWPSGRRLMWCDESGGGAPIAHTLSAAGPGAWAALVGPVGGFAPEELDGLRKLAFVTPVSLGARVLKADTAVLAALVCLQALVGDWGSARAGTDDV